MQRKKKPQTQQDQKHLATQYRADFFCKMKRIIDSVCGADIYPLIPQYILDDAYLCRSAPFKFKIEYNSNVPTKTLNDAKAILPNLIKKQNILLPPNNLEITLYDFYTVVFTIIILNSRIADTTFAHAAKVKEALQFFVNDTATNEIANQHMHSILYTYNLYECDLRKTLFWYKYDMIIPKIFPSETENFIIINSTTPETITVVVDGNARPAIRVGWAFAFIGAEWLSLKPSVLGFKSPFAEIPLKVYIQSHAINRLLERIDCFWSGYIQFNIHSSLVAPIIAHDTNNNLLIEFRIFGTKAGYFRADVVEGIILIRTFLFITNNGTPEGQLLEKNTGLQKFDKKYLAIDKLSTFMNSDLDKNVEVQQIFINAGCQCLIDLYNNMKYMLIKKNKNFNFDYMLSYINANHTHTIKTND